MTDPPPHPGRNAGLPGPRVPRHARRSFGSLLMVLTGFTFCTATMFTGDRLGSAFPLPELLLVLAGNLLLGGYAARASGLKCGADGRLRLRRAGQPLAGSAARRHADLLVRPGHGHHSRVPPPIAAGAA